MTHKAPPIALESRETCLSLMLSRLESLNRHFHEVKESGTPFEEVVASIAISRFEEFYQLVDAEHFNSNLFPHINGILEEDKALDLVDLFSVAHMSNAVRFTKTVGVIDTKTKEIADLREDYEELRASLRVSVRRLAERSPEFLSIMQDFFSKTNPNEFLFTLDDLAFLGDITHLPKEIGEEAARALIHKRSAFIGWVETNSHLEDVSTLSASLEAVVALREQQLAEAEAHIDKLDSVRALELAEPVIGPEAVDSKV